MDTLPYKDSSFENYLLRILEACAADCNRRYVVVYIYSIPVYFKLW